MELCKTKAKSGCIDLEMGGYLAYIPLGTLMLALVGVGVGGPFFML